MTILRAGVARRATTPPVGIYLMGYGNREQGNIGARDELYVTTLVLGDEQPRVALLTVDHTFINTRIIQEIQTRIEAMTGIPEAGVFVSCSHTHAGPIGYADERSKAEDRAYITFLIEQLVASAVEATQTMQPVHLCGGTDESHININRREMRDGVMIIGQNPDGPVDHSVQVVQVVNEAEKPLATLVNYACHPVVLGNNNRLASADWVGAMRQEVEQTTGALCLFFQGTTADINPRKMDWARDNWDEVEEQGLATAEGVKRALGKLTPLETGTIETQQETIWLKLMPTQGYTDLMRSFFNKATSDEEIANQLHDEFPWYTEIEERVDGFYSPVRVGILKMGDWAIATMETEPFAETGLAIKAASPAKMTFTVGYSNGCNSYLPPESAYVQGGYEVETAALFYGLPAPFAAGGAEIITSRIIKILRG